MPILTLEDLSQELKDVRRRKPQGTAGAWDIELDLGGCTLSGPLAPPGLAVAKGARVRLANGALVLPPRCMVEVQQGCALELQGLSVSGEGVGQHGLVTVRGPGACALLQHCSVRGLGAGCRRTWKPRYAVLVCEGATAALRHCTLSAGQGQDLCVRGRDSRATVAHCSGEAGQRQIFSHAGALLTMQEGQAHGDPQAGQASGGHGSEEQCGPSVAPGAAAEGGVSSQAPGRAQGSPRHQAGGGRAAGRDTWQGCLLEFATGVVWACVLGSALRVIASEFQLTQAGSRSARAQATGPCEGEEQCRGMAQEECGPAPSPRPAAPM